MRGGARIKQWISCLTFNCNYCSRGTRNWVRDVIGSHLFHGPFLQDQGRSMTSWDPRKKYIAHITTRVIAFVFEKQYSKNLDHPSFGYLKVSIQEIVCTVETQRRQTNKRQSWLTNWLLLTNHWPAMDYFYSMSKFRDNSVYSLIRLFYLDWWICPIEWSYVILTIKPDNYR